MKGQYIYSPQVERFASITSQNRLFTYLFKGTMSERKRKSWESQTLRAIQEFSINQWFKEKHTHTHERTHALTLCTS